MNNKPELIHTIPAGEDPPEQELKEDMQMCVLERRLYPYEHERFVNEQAMRELKEEQGR